MCDLGAALDHEGPLPHPACDQMQWRRQRISARRDASASARSAARAASAARSLAFPVAAFVLMDGGTAAFAAAGNAIKT
jgi:hypothetical protein